MRRIIFPTILSAVLLVSLGCAPTYHEASNGVPHATLKCAQGDPFFALNNPHVGILEIDGLPVNRLNRGFGADRLIPPGTHRIRVMAIDIRMMDNDRKSRQAVADFEIDIIGGKIYVIDYKDKADSVIYSIREEKSGNEIAIIEAPRGVYPEDFEQVIGGWYR